MTTVAKHDKPRVAVCITSEGYATSLVPRRLHQLSPDEKASSKGLVRVIDDTGEDYLFPTSMFEEIDLPDPIREKLKFRE